jgi:predicted RNase H-like HicB family nuclease
MVMGMAKYMILIEKGIHNYSAYCPDLPGVIATGITKKETVAVMRDAIQFHLEGLRQLNQKIPEPVTQASTVIV